MLHGQRRIGPAGGHVAGPSVLEHVRHAHAVHALEGLDHLQHAAALPRTQVDGLAAHVGQAFHGPLMALGEVHHVDVVAQPRAVGHGVVAVPHAELLELAGGHLEQEGHQVVGNTVGILADQAALVGSHRIEVAKQAHVLGGAMDGLRRLGMVFRGRNWRLMRGCNFSVSAEAMRAVGGFDESYEGWGYEDSDLCVRLLRLGLRIRQAPADTCVLHLWHENRDRGEEPANRERLQDVLGTRRVQAVRGLRTAPATAQRSHFV
jgi:hypothetical protein